MLTQGPTDEESRIVSDHFAYLTQLRDIGVLILAGRTQTTGIDTFGIVIFRADDDEAAKAVMQHDPAVSNDVMGAQIFPFSVALSSL